MPRLMLMDSRAGASVCFVHNSHFFYEIEPDRFIAFWELHGEPYEKPFETRLSKAAGLPEWVNHISYYSPSTAAGSGWETPVGQTIAERSPNNQNPWVRRWSFVEYKTQVGFIDLHIDAGEVEITRGNGQTIPPLRFLRL
jgi:hypothetical protein